jgi:hypothetical protein
MQIDVENNLKESFKIMLDRKIRQFDDSVDEVKASIEEMQDTLEEELGDITFNRLPAPSRRKESSSSISGKKAVLAPNGTAAPTRKGAVTKVHRPSKDEVIAMLEERTLKLTALIDKRFASLPTVLEGMLPKPLQSLIIRPAADPAPLSPDKEIRLVQ